ncbi:MAG: FtsW/RodA/SpoVE family cell cycle protein, partial [Deltaproteobacteria bacterium]|nr:FtsW/RodA/SpoVE family cell cycle protein [Deltaproteobacteria bacterium]
MAHQVQRPERLPPDPILIATGVALTAFGVVMVFSASAVFASESRFTGHSPYYFLVRQAVYAAIAFPCLLLAAFMPASLWRRLAYPSFWVSIGLMLATLFIGRRVGGAIRWLEFGPVRIQPAEFAKVALILALSHSLAKKTPEQMRSFRVGVLPHLLLMAPLA